MNLAIILQIRRINKLTMECIASSFNKIATKSNAVWKLVQHSFTLSNIKIHTEIGSILSTDTGMENIKSNVIL